MNAQSDVDAEQIVVVVGVVDVRRLAAVFVRSSPVFGAGRPISSDKAKTAEFVVAPLGSA
ncbi:MAG: hypothetical protein ACREBC_08715 [Pyrinomonadaceae bacterium]